MEPESSGFGERPLKQTIPLETTGSDTTLTLFTTTKTTHTHTHHWIFYSLINVFLWLYVTGMAFEKRLELEGEMGGETGGEPTFASKAYMCITGHAYGHVFPYVC